MRSLPDNEYFNVLSFSSKSMSLFQHSPQSTKEEIDKAVNLISSMDADISGTDILIALQDLVKDKRFQIIQDCCVSILMEQSATSAMLSPSSKAHQKHTHLFNRNRKLLFRGVDLSCAEKGKVCYTFITNDEKPQQKIINLLEKALSPVISDIQLDYDESQRESVVPNPKNMPFILKGDLINFCFSFNHTLTDVIKILIQSKDSAGKQYNKQKRSIQIEK